MHENKALNVLLFAIIYTSGQRNEGELSYMTM